jgi:hypothetical protein
MPIFVGSTEINDIKIGNTEINEVYVGANKVWERATVLTVTNDTYYEQMNLSQGSWHKYDYNGFASGTIYWSNNQGDLADSSISPTTFTNSTYSGADPVVEALHHVRFRTSAGSDLKYILFTLNKNITNDGWTTMTIGSTNYNRADAVFQNSGWRWENVGSNPFIGTTTEVSFT